MLKAIQLFSTAKKNANKKLEIKRVKKKADELVVVLVVENVQWSVDLWNISCSYEGCKTVLLIFFGVKAHKYHFWHVERQKTKTTNRFVWLSVLNS